MNVLIDPSARPVVGHRGNRAYAPENTIESFAQAVQAGADAIEFDVRLSSDGIPVVMHDPAVNRTTDGNGVVRELTFDAIRKLDAGARFTRDNGATFPYRGQRHRVPSLDEVIDAFPSTPLLIEIKTVDAALAVRRSIEAHGAEARTLVDSMEGDAMRVFTDSAIAIGAARGDVIRGMTELLLHLPLTPFAYRALCIPLSHNGIPVPVGRFARAAKSQNCVVHVWTINHPAVATRLWKLGVQGIITDDPAVMLRARALLPR